MPASVLLRKVLCPLSKFPVWVWSRFRLFMHGMIVKNGGHMFGNGVLPTVIRKVTSDQLRSASATRLRPIWISRL